MWLLKLCWREDHYFTCWICCYQWLWLGCWRFLHSSYRLSQVGGALLQWFLKNGCIQILTSCTLCFSEKLNRPLFVKISLYIVTHSSLSLVTCSKRKEIYPSSNPKDIRIHLKISPSITSKAFFSQIEAHPEKLFIYCSIVVKCKLRRFIIKVSWYWNRLTPTNNSHHYCQGP